jgi:hypothetical protein
MHTRTHKCQEHSPFVWLWLIQIFKDYHGCFMPLTILGRKSLRICRGLHEDVVLLFVWRYRVICRDCLFWSHSLNMLSKKLSLIAVRRTKTSGTLKANWNRDDCYISRLLAICCMKWFLGSFKNLLCIYTRLFNTSNKTVIHTSIKAVYQTLNITHISSEFLVSDFKYFLLDSWHAHSSEICN